MFFGPLIHMLTVWQDMDDDANTSIEIEGKPRFVAFVREE
jgi:hypothetical protein